MEASNGTQARLSRAEHDIERLMEGKADAKDVERMMEEFRSVKRSLQWFMGIVATAVFFFFGLIVTLLQGAG